MNVGSAKGAIVSELITREQPRTMVELGGYVGYSTILFSSAMKMANQPSSRDSQRPRYFCLERNPEFAAVIGSLIDLAGLKDVVEIVVGPSDTSIQRLWREGIFADGIDLMFLDHYKPAYTMDLKLCEELGLVKPGRTVLAADNVVFPGNPTYLEYVRSSVAEKRAALKASTTTQQEGIANASGVDQRFLERTAKQYERREGESKLNTSLKGNPDLVYESRLVESFEPTGDPVCLNSSALNARPARLARLVRLQ